MNKIIKIIICSILFFSSFLSGIVITTASGLQGPFNTISPMIRIFTNDSEQPSTGMNQQATPKTGVLQSSEVEAHYLWVADKNLSISKIQFHSSAPGKAVIRIYSVDGNKPAAKLGEVFFQSSTNGWQGVNFEEPIEVQQGVSYFLSYGHENDIYNYVAVGSNVATTTYYWNDYFFHNVVDTQPPTAPDLYRVKASGTQVKLEWRASTDNIGVKNYHIYRNTERVGTTHRLEYVDEINLSNFDIKEEDEYLPLIYTVRAMDFAENLSEHSEPKDVYIKLKEDPPPTDDDELQIGTGTWELKKLFEHVSEFTVEVDGLTGVTSYGIYSKSGVELAQQPFGTPIRQLSILFTELDDLEVQFFSNGILVAKASLEVEDYSDGNGHGTLIFEGSKKNPGDDDDLQVGTGTWQIKKSYEDALTSDLRLDVEDLDGATSYAIYSKEHQIFLGDQVLGQELRQLSVLFTNLADLQIWFYSGSNVIAKATLEGDLDEHGDGTGELVFKGQKVPDEEENQVIPGPIDENPDPAQGTQDPKDDDLQVGIGTWEMKEVEDFQLISSLSIDLSQASSDKFSEVTQFAIYLDEIELNKVSIDDELRLLSILFLYLEELEVRLLDANNEIVATAEFEGENLAGALIFSDEGV